MKRTVSSVIPSRTRGERLRWAAVTAVPIVLMVLGGCVSYAQLLSQDSVARKGNGGPLLEVGVLVSAFQLSIGLSTFLGNHFSLCAFTVSSGDMTLQLYLQQVLASVNAVPHLTVEETQATMWVALRLASALIGVLFGVLGKLNATAALSYLPYPVVAGFLAMVGVAIMKSAFLLLWPKGDQSPLILVLGCALAGSSTVAKSFGMPSNVAAVLAIVVSIAAFWLWALLSGREHESLVHDGWLLPKAEAVPAWRPFTVVDLASVHWRHVLPDPSSAVLAMVACINRALTTAAIEAACSDTSYSVDAEMRQTGFRATCVGGALGGVCMNPSSGMSSVCKDGCQGDKDMARYVVLIATCAYLGLWLSGLPLTNILPRFLIGGLLMMMGLGMLVDWGWYVRKRIERSSLAIIYFMILWSLWTGLIQGVLLGLGIALVVVSTRFARLEVLKYHITGVHFRSPRVYSAVQRSLLGKYGHRTHIIGVTGFLFEGVAIYLSKYLREIIRACETPNEEQELRTIILDFFACQGVNDSACAHLMKVRLLCRQQGIQFLLSNLYSQDQELLKCWGFKEFPEGRESALAEAECEILAEFGEPWREPQPLSLDEGSERLAAEHALASWLGEDAATELIWLPGAQIVLSEADTVLNKELKDPKRNIFVAIPSHSEVRLEVRTGNKQRPAVLFHTLSGAVCGGEALIDQTTRGVWRALKPSAVLALPCAATIKCEAPVAFAALLAATLHQQVQQTDQFSSLYTISRGGGWQGVTFDGWTSHGAQAMMELLGKQPARAGAEQAKGKRVKEKFLELDVVDEDHVGAHLVAAVLERKDSLGPMSPIVRQERPSGALDASPTTGRSGSKSSRAEDFLTLNRDSVGEGLNRLAFFPRKQAPAKPSLDSLFGDVEAQTLTSPGAPARRPVLVGCPTLPELSIDEEAEEAEGEDQGGIVRRMSAQFLESPLGQALLSDHKSFG